MQENPIVNILPISSSTIIKENLEYKFKIHVCEPENGDYRILVTDGLRNNLQAVNQDNLEYKHIELYMSLPQYWNLEERSWPVEWLNRIAQIPQKNDTWFGLGDTIPAGNPAESLDEKLAANNFILFKPIKHQEDFSTKILEELNIRLLAVVPIFQDELDFKLKNSHSMLYNRFLKKGLTEQLDLFRTTTCKKRLFGMFG